MSEYTFAGLVACAVMVPASCLVSARWAAMRGPKIMRQCMEFDLSVAAARYRHESNYDAATAAHHEREFRRFFALIVLNPGIHFGLQNGVVDDFWHTLICCTSLYRSYCQATAGHFVDHDPVGGSDIAYAKTWQTYRTTFGEAPDPWIWPRPDEAALEAVTPPQNGRAQGYNTGSSCGGGAGGCSGGHGGGHGCGGGGHGCGGGGGH